MTQSQQFQTLLRELFQFDRTDLDFGIYRIMNYKRETIEKFISTDLFKAIADSLDHGALAEQSQAAVELGKTISQIANTLGKDALDADGNLAEAYHGTPLGKKYIDLKGKTAGGRGREAIEATIFNHLYAFFSRYYQDGDFISKRRYSRRQKYAIPYNGEEVYFHWANHDQYYVKTAEHFHDYNFTSGDSTVQFKLTAANVEQNNVKGEKRFFLPRLKEIDWNEKALELIIPFEFRPLTDREKVTYGTKNQQEKIISVALEAIPKCLKKANKLLVAITAERHKSSDSQPVSFLEYHLRQYTRTNTSDFFIHKNLKGFLSRELDFYLKNEVLNLDEMEVAGEERSDGWFQVFRVIKAVGSRIIDFLDQIESFQRMLWEKRKFVTETQYCITIGSIDESFYPDIAACDAQWAEWNELFHIDDAQPELFSNGRTKKGRRIEFLKMHPTLLIDTARFSPEFKDRLVGAFERIEDFTDVLLINSDNFHGLRLLDATYHEQVKCIYIDPPYNTDASPILYKNGYKSSSWVSMMDDRLKASKSLMTTDGVLVAAIDDEQQRELSFLMSRVFQDHLLGTICVRANPSGRPMQTGYSVSHEYLIFAGKSAKSYIRRLPPTEAQMARFSERDEHGAFEWRNLRREGADSDRDARRTMYYPIYLKDDKIRVPRMKWDDEREEWQALERPQKGEVVAWPDNEHGHAKRWRWEWPTVIDSLDILSVRPDRSGRPYVYYKRRPHEDGVVSVSSWYDAKYSATEHGTAVIKALFGRSIFSYPKSIYAAMDSIYVAGGSSPSAIVLDYFAGSGTSVHATINLNRIDAGRRKCIAIEVEKYFDAILLPRVKKVVFSPEWRDGKPQRMATAEEASSGPRVIKYLRVESFEDTMSNIAFDDASHQGSLQFEDYLLKYMLKWETRTSETLLNVKQLAKPFSYKLTVASGDARLEKVVDLAETFNYLLGLHVSTRKVYEDDGRRYLVYHGRVGHRRIAVIWRETEGWQKKDLERDKKFVAEQSLTEGADEVFVNGDSFIPRAKALEPLFKARMFSTTQT